MNKAEMKAALRLSAENTRLQDRIDALELALELSADMLGNAAQYFYNGNMEHSAAAYRKVAEHARELL